MKRFLIQILIFITLTFGVLAIAGHKYHSSGNDYMDAIIDKHRLLDTTKQPRIIFAGGSNLAFGIDSKMIHDSIGYNVVNMGLHAGLGLEYIINELKFSLKPDDIVIFSIEHFLGNKGDYLLKKQTAKNFNEANNFFRRNYWTDIKNYFEKEITKNLKNNLSLKKRDTAIDTISIYARSSFNKYGDVVRHLTKPIPEKISGRGKKKYTYWQGIELLNEFQEYANSNNITTYFMFANYPNSEYMENKDVLLQYENDVKNDLHITVLTDMEDFIFNDSLFFDTSYHLNRNGRNIRTIKLIEILKRNKICL